MYKNEVDEIRFGLLDIRSGQVLLRESSDVLN